ncbi:MAG: AzlC family ABC transporter permease, partial [Alkalispirochaeta sp.]
MRQLASGLLASLPIASGYVPVAITFGLIVRSGGLSVIDAGLASLIIFAGAAQFLAAGMYFSGAGVLQIVIAGWLLNLRHLLMSSVIAEHLDRSASMPIRTILAFGVTDEVFGVAGRRAARGDTLDASYLIGLELGAYTAWVGGTFIGAIVGDILPPPVRTAMGMALYALFAALLAGLIREAGTTSTRVQMAGAAVLAGGANWFLRNVSGLEPGVAFPIAMITTALLFAIRPPDND